MARRTTINPEVLDLLTPQDEMLEKTPPDEASHLEEAANTLLSRFTPSIRDFACEVADLVLKIPRWQLLCGSLLAQYESGSLPAPSLDPAWTKGEVVEVRGVCEQCGVEFEPRKFRQRYCSNACGSKAITEKRGLSADAHLSA